MGLINQLITMGHHIVDPSQHPIFPLSPVKNSTSEWGQTLAKMNSIACRKAPPYLAKLIDTRRLVRGYGRYIYIYT